MTATGYDEWTAAVHLDAAAGGIDRCIAAASQAAGDTAHVQLRVDDDGAAHGCRATGVEPPVGSCVCASLRALNWSPPPGGSAQVSVRYALE